MRRRRTKKVVAMVLWAAMIIPAAISSVGAQPSMVRIGVLTPGITLDPALDGLREGLRKLGYWEGKNLHLTIVDSKGDTSNFLSLAAKLVESKPDLLVTVAPPATAAVKKTTQTIPIVFTVVGEPVESGLVASIASSRNNLTGVWPYTSPLSGKRLELLKEIAGQTRKILTVVSVKENTSLVALQFLEETAKKLDVRVLRRDVASVGDIEKNLVEKWAGSVDAIFHVPSVLVGSSIELLIAKAKNEKLPFMVHDDALVDKGALISYGSDYRSLGIQTAQIVAKVLKGTKPSDIAIETPDRLLLSINLSTAKAIGLKLPRQVLDRADRLVD